MILKLDKINCKFLTNIIAVLQEMEKTWFSPHQISCEDLSRNISRTLKSFKDMLENATDHNCECKPSLESVQLHMYRYERVQHLNFYLFFSIKKMPPIKNVILDSRVSCKSINGHNFLNINTFHDFIFILFLMILRQYILNVNISNFNQVYSLNHN